MGKLKGASREVQKAAFSNMENVTKKATRYSDKPEEVKVEEPKTEETDAEETKAEETEE